MGGGGVSPNLHFVQIGKTVHKNGRPLRDDIKISGNSLSLHCKIDRGGRGDELSIFTSDFPFSHRKGETSTVKIDRNLVVNYDRFLNL